LQQNPVNAKIIAEEKTLIKLFIILSLKEKKNYV